MRLTASQVAFGLVTLSANTVSAQTQTSLGVEEPSAAPTLAAQIVQGCFSSAGQLTPMNGTVQYNSKSKCAHDICYVQGYNVAATLAGNQCLCGNKYPPKSSLVEDSQCNVLCPGYGLQACGGISSYTVYNTGVILNVDYSSDADASSAIAATVSSSSTTKAAASTAATTVVNGGQTTVVYVTASATSDSNAATSSSSGPSVGGIVAGVVAGVLAMAAIGAGLFFYMRARRNRDIEAEHRRSAAVNAFMANGGKPPGSSGGFSADTDSRLDPVMAQRRMSSGSIADNQDYSRKILRVTNA